jgi:Tfp pilus assembly protein PilV
MMFNCITTRIESTAHSMRRSKRQAVANRRSDAGQRGFSLLEATIALLLMLVIALGSASLFSFSIYNNSGGSDRATSLAIAQQALEVARSAQFNSTTTDIKLNGGSRVEEVIRDERRFTVTRTIDDNPATPETEIDTNTNLKRITITVVPRSIGRGWAFGAGGTVNLYTLRSRTDR